ncbi:MAG: enoyl-CoA hydratase-related protein [Candidatus Calescibacterium sp.]|nr:enoyl-CoA hydratase-related protein [Candidatus Calescibacterium sp.]MCX7734309.1 enoyl-CoA hydratase-related protein [bacterium]MDW8087141.1 enoyl-CoA hydratase-related protein [Candidatus Calescibacterium sp.]
MYETIIFEKTNEKGIITLNRPERRNSISPKMTEEILDAFEKHDKDPDVKVVIITGSGDKSFCAGGDLAPDPSGPQSFLDRYESSRKFAEIFRVFEKYTKPIVARINGDALGGGFGLAVACDISVAVDTAKLGTPEINIGLFPYVIMATLIRNTSNPKKLLEMMLTGERISAKEACELGFINYVVPPEQLDAKVNEIVEKLLSKSPAILRLGRRAYYTARELEFSKSLELLSSMLSLNTMAEDLIEGVSAFFQKRKPEWKGR